MRGRRLRCLLVPVVVLAGLAGCSSEAETTEKKLRAVLSATEHVAHRFVYRETFRSGEETTETAVQGLVEDDLRYKARVSVGDVAVLDEVVSDDALAVRLIQPDALGEFLRRPAEQGGSGAGVGDEAPGGQEGVTPAGGFDGPDPVAALRSRRWVLDRAGAPAVFAANPAEQRPVGEDPVLDALDIFAHVEQAINEASYIAEYSEEALEPVYRDDEDPFDRPEEGSGVTRYDFAAPSLPKASDRQGGNQVTPDARHFRKMAVYVKEGKILRVSEVIDVAARLDDLAEVYDTDFPTDRSDEEVAVIAIEALNAIRTGQGQDPIRLRTMSYTMSDLGGDVRVEVPSEVVETRLALLQHRGRPADVPAGVALAEEVRAAARAAAAAEDAPSSEGVAAPAPEPTPSG